MRVCVHASSQASLLPGICNALPASKTQVSCLAKILQHGNSSYCSLSCFSCYPHTLPLVILAVYAVICWSLIQLSLQSFMSQHCCYAGWRRSHQWLAWVKLNGEHHGDASDLFFLKLNDCFCRLHIQGVLRIWPSCTDAYQKHLLDRLKTHIPIKRGSQSMIAATLFQKTQEWNPVLGIRGTLARAITSW